MTTRITVKNTFCLLASIATLFAFAFWLTLPQQAIAEDEGTPALMAGGTSFDLSQQNAGGLSFVSLSGDSVVGSGTNPSGYTIYVRDGDVSTVELNVRNATSEQIDYIDVTQGPSYGEGDDAWEPIVFPHPRTNRIDPPVENTYYDSYRWYTSQTSTWEYSYSAYGGFSIEPGVTATFTLRIGAGDLPNGTYDWSLELGRIRYDYESRIVVIDPTLSYPETFFLGQETEDTFVTIPIRVVVYNQANASIQAGVNTGTGFSPQIDGSPINFGTINLASADESALSATRDIWVLNNRTAHSSDRVANVTDARGNPVTVTVDFGLETFVNGQSGYILNSPFSLGGSDTTFSGFSWEPLPPRTDNSFSYANSGITFDATYFIAGTYTGNFLVRTAPHKLLVNDQMNDGTGVHRIPVSVTLTGINPRLLPRVSDLAATPNNGYVELTWTPADGASEYTEYTIYRRVGTEANGNPDTWSWEGYEAIGTKMVGDNDELLYIDANVENGTTYSYTVICGVPYRGYAAVAATATPSASIQSRMLAPISSYSSSLNCVEVEWHMNDLYGGYQSDGAGMVDHFNIYRDGVLVDVIYRSAVGDTVTFGWHDDGTGTDTYIYGPVSHDYSWMVEEPVPELYVDYQWTVSAVSPSGVESYLGEEGPAYAYGDVPTISGHEAYFEDDLYDYSGQYFDEPEIYDGPAMMIVLEAHDGMSETPELRVWRNEGTSAPDTSQPVCSTIGFNGARLADRGVVAGRTYTYTVQPMNGSGEVGDYYTFTVKAVTPSSSDYYYFSTPNVTWRIVGGTTASLRFSAPKNITATVYRNGSKLNSTPSDDYYTWYFDIQDDPGADGTYVYRVEYTYSGITTSREFTFVRNTQPMDTSGLLKPPDAPTLTARTAGDSNVILSWAPATTGGTPEGYHIYRTDGDRQIANGRYLTGHRGNGDYEYYQRWGNGRYITLSGGDTLSFVDGRVLSSSYYMGDSHKGEITDLAWDDSNLPHTYYITAYNRAGESAPSELVVFSESVENPSGYPIAPPNLVDELPAAPTIERVWVELSDTSSYRNGFASWLDGYVHVAWSDSDFGADIDSWKATFAGTYADQYNPPKTRSLSYQMALVNPQAKQGVSDDAPKCGLRIEMGNSGDIGRTITVTVAAENGLGSASSEPLSVVVLDAPRFYALPDNGGALLRWTDLSKDTTTQITGWEIWRRPAYGLWERVDTLPGSLPYSGTQTGSDNVDVSYYQWIDTELENGWTYEYKVVAKCGDGLDRPSVVREVTPKATAAVEAPGAPRNLTAQVVNGVVILSWDEPVTGGAVERYAPQVLGPGISEWFYGTISSVSGTSTSTTWMPSTPGTYQVIVAATSSADGVTLPDVPIFWQIPGYDDMTDDEKLEVLYPNHSNVVEVTVTQADIDAQPTGNGYPGSFSITLTPGEGQVAVSWTASDNALYYTVERHNNNYPKMPDATVAAVPGQQTYTFVDDTAEPGVRYRYVVSAYSRNRGLYNDGYATAYGVTHDELVAERVAALIDADDFPAVAQVEAVDLEADPHGLDAYEAQVADVREVYDSLTDKQKSYVSNAAKQKLQSVEAAIVAKKYEAIIAPVQDLIDDLPSASVIAGADEESLDGIEALIAAARSAYNEISPAEAKQGVDLSKLEAAERALAAARQRIADQKAADAVSAQIADLPEADALSSDDREAFEAQRASIVEARAAFNGLSVAQRELVDTGALEKLAACETRVSVLEKYYADAEAAASVVALIDALPDPASDAFTLADAGDVAIARTQYEGLTADQQAFVSQDQLDKLAACEARVEELKTELAQMEAAEAAGFVGGIIGAIPNIDDLDAMTLVSRPAVQEAREAFELLSDDAKTLVEASGQLAKLEAAEAKIARLEADEVGALIARLPDADKITLDDEVAVAAARAAFDALSEYQQGYLADAAQPHLEAAEARIAKLKAEAAEAARIDISGGTARLSATSFTYNGKAHKPSATLVVAGKTLKSGVDFTVGYARYVNAGQATATLSGIGAYKGTLKVPYTIKKAAGTLSAKAKSKQIKAKASKLKRKKQVIKKAKAFVVSGAHGKVTFKKLKGNKKIAVSASGNVTLKKKLKKGIYKVKVSVSDAGNANYLQAKKNVVIKIRVK